MTRTGDPNTDSGGGISCSAALPLDTHVKLVAKSGDGLAIRCVT
jgi:hypothetical protein